MVLPRGLMVGVIVGAVLGGLFMAVGVPLLDSGPGARPAPHEFDRDADDADSAAQRIRISGGRRQIQLHADERALAGIVLAELETALAVPEQHLAGVVADAPALTAAAESVRRGAAGIALQRELVADIDGRRAALLRLNAASALGAKREIATLERELLQARVELQHMIEVRADRYDRMRAQWGAALLEAYDDSAPLRAALAAGTTALVEFSVPANGTVTGPPAAARIGLNGRRDQAVPGTILAAAESSGGRAQGRAWYAAVSGLDLRRDMRPDVWVPTGDTVIKGLLVPDAAVVWRGGRAWFYAAVAASRYERRPLDALVSHPRGYLVDAAGAPREIVVAGAQALLAEEFHAAIPVEDDD